ncbi:MAG TPA: hypothetical protein VGY31_03470 [Terriglobia bacterium]|nr:hypothetical protein [Terriglobia bacterium]
MTDPIFGVILLVGVQIGAMIFAFGKLFERVGTHKERLDRIESKVFNGVKHP